MRRALAQRSECRKFFYDWHLTCRVCVCVYCRRGKRNR